MREITYSRNVFIPLTFVCHNRCGYCTFRQQPKEGCVLSRDEINSILREGSYSNCTEALFTFGERPEKEPSFMPYLQAVGHDSILDYCYEMSELAIAAGLLPHTNAGILTTEEMARLKEVNASMGLMLETTADIPAHRKSPGKNPRIRIEMIEEAGRLQIPFTTGLLLGIGETRKDRIDSLEVIADLHKRYDHIQEVIIQNFCPKPGTEMAKTPGATTAILKDTVGLAAEILPKDISIQIPPNLADICEIIPCGVTDLGGISPVTIDYVNPEHPWPEYESLAKTVAGYKLRERLCVYPKYIEKGWYSDRIRDLITILEERIIKRSLEQR